jgi:hypothetical protein
MKIVGKRKAEDGSDAYDYCCVVTPAGAASGVGGEVEARWLREDDSALDQAVRKAWEMQQEMHTSPSPQVLNEPASASNPRQNEEQKEKGKEKGKRKEKKKGKEKETQTQKGAGTEKAAKPDGAASAATAAMSAAAGAAAAASTDEDDEEECVALASSLPSRSRAQQKHSRRPAG